MPVGYSPQQAKFWADIATNQHRKLELMRDRDGYYWLKAVRDPDGSVSLLATIAPLCVIGIYDHTPGIKCMYGACGKVITIVKTATTFFISNVLGHHDAVHKLHIRARHLGAKGAKGTPTSHKRKRRAGGGRGAEAKAARKTDAR